MTMNTNLSTSSMGIELNDFTFELILNNLYSQPHEATVRELVCNAIDSQLFAKNLKSYHIQVPTQENPVFILRDFGTGLNPAEVDKYLNTLLSGTKRESTLDMGCYGLGAKSPFSFVNSYFLESYKLGKLYKYKWDRVGSVPILTFISEELTDQPDGLKFTIPLLDKDIYPILRSFGMLSFCQILPRYFTDIEDESTEKDLSTFKYFQSLDDKIHLYTVPKHIYSQNYLRIGSAVYPFPNSFTNYLGGSGLVVVYDIPINALKLHVSRETILSTVENTDKLLEFAADFKHRMSMLLATIFSDITETNVERYLSKETEVPFSLVADVLKEFYKKYNFISLDLLQYLPIQSYLDGDYLEAIQQDYPELTSATELRLELQSMSLSYLSDQPYRKRQPVFNSFTYFNSPFSNRLLVRTEGEVTPVVSLTRSFVSQYFSPYSVKDNVILVQQSYGTNFFRCLLTGLGYNVAYYPSTKSYRDYLKSQQPDVEVVIRPAPPSGFKGIRLVKISTLSSYTHYSAKDFYSRASVTVRTQAKGSLDLSYFPVPEGQEEGPLRLFCIKEEDPFSYLSYLRFFKFDYIVVIKNSSFDKQVSLLSALENTVVMTKEDYYSFVPRLPEAVADNLKTAFTAREIMKSLKNLFSTLSFTSDLKTLLQQLFEQVESDNVHLQLIKNNFNLLYSSCVLWNLYELPCFSETEINIKENYSAINQTPYLFLKDEILLKEYKTFFLESIPKELIQEYLVSVVLHINDKELLANLVRKLYES